MSKVIAKTKHYFGQWSKYARNFYVKDTATTTEEIIYAFWNVVNEVDNSVNPAIGPWRVGHYNQLQAIDASGPDDDADFGWSGCFSGGRIR